MPKEYATKEEVEGLTKQIERLSSNLNIVLDILRASKEIQSVLLRTDPHWVKYYDTESGFIDEHVNKFHWEKGSSLGFALPIDLKKRLEKE